MAKASQIGYIRLFPDCDGQTLLRVPFFTQWGLQDEPGTRLWAPRTCAIACLTMVLEFWGARVTLAQVLDRALAAGAWDETRNWIHSGLVAVLQEHGLMACRRNWRLLDGHEKTYLAGRQPGADTAEELDWVRDQMLAEGLATVTGLLAQGVPVITSVYRPFGDHRGPGHQIVLIGSAGGRLHYHDPAERDGERMEVSMETFLANWKGTGIIAMPRDHPQNRLNRP
jgi:hypothetical protein